MQVTIKAKQGTMYALAVDGVGAEQAPASYVNFFDRKKGYAELPPTPMALEQFLNWARDVGVDLKVPTPIHVAMEKEERKRDLFSWASVVEGRDELDNRLYEHQKIGVAYALINKQFNGGKFRLLIADDPRLGKSPQSLVALKNSEPGRVLILCPKALLLQWKTYVETWLEPDGFRSLVLRGSEKTRKQDLDTFFQFEEEGWKVVITNWESMYMNSLNLNSRGFVYFIGDEAHKLKNRKSKIVTAVGNLTIPNIILLSATFVEDMPSDWWAPLNIIAPNRYTSYWRWVGHYIESYWGGYGIEFGAPRHMDIMKDDVRPYILQRRSDEVADMPEKIKETLVCEMADWHEEFYRKLETQTRIELSEGILSVPNVISRITRLRQAAVHPMLLDKEFDGRGYETGKMEMLKILFEDVIPFDQQAIIYCSFIDGCEAIRRTLEDHASFIYAGAQAYESDIQKFQDGEHRIMIGTPGKGGVGLNLFNANYVVFADMPWSTISVRQAEERVRAIGKQGPVYVYTLALANTVDAYVTAKVQAKLANVGESEVLQLAHDYLEHKS